MRVVVVSISCIALLVFTGCGRSSFPGSVGYEYELDSGATVVPRAATQDSSFNTEEYDYISENEFENPRQNPLSTFAIDVDTAAYANVRRMLRSGQLPPAGAVRIEELVNYFSYDYPQPARDCPFSVSSEVADCPWESQHRLVRIGIQGRNVSDEASPARHLVFLVDCSGSMDDARKLPLVKQAMVMLVNELDRRDSVAVVSYAGSSGVVLKPTSADRKREITNAVMGLRAGGGTNGAAGIETAYALLAGNYEPDAVHRVIVCTDGDFNIGSSSQDELIRLIESKRDVGIELSVLGFGMGNYKDSRMEQLADHGNGNYAYIDTELEAHKVLVRELSGTLVTIAKDVKIQVEFNPHEVASYRLVGYENRKMPAQDFLNDRKDAGEIGAGHCVTAFYEVVPAHSEFAGQTDHPLRYQLGRKPSAQSESGELFTLKLRYKEPTSNVVAATEFRGFDMGGAFSEASSDFRFAAAVAAYGMRLRNSAFSHNINWGDIDAWAAASQGHDRFGYRKEFLELVRLASSLTKRDL
ncbi:MAG: von Willebrand factor type A domain-containing protein [Planctomycetales bacterium]|nr:von Willebrand factor type A domain-containing protein [Planctomycetales bacterium]